MHSQEHFLDLRFNSHVNSHKYTNAAIFLAKHDRYPSLMSRPLTVRPKACYTPHDIDQYRVSIWDRCGENNFNALIRMKLCSPFTDSSYLHDSSQKNIWNFFYNTLIVFKPALSLSQKYLILNAFCEQDNLYVFDSYWFFASGHFVNLVHTIESLFLLDSNCLIVLYVDSMMILFREAIELLKHNYERLIVLDTNDTPLSFVPANPTNCIDNATSLNSSLRITSHKTFINIRNSVFNPHIILLKDYYSTSADVDQTKKCISFFGSIYSKFYSREYIQNYLLEHDINVTDKKIVAYHERNSDFRWPSLRNSKPLNTRADLISYFECFNMHIIVLGVVPPENQIKNQNIIMI